MVVRVHFLPSDIAVEAEPGEPLLAVASRAGVTIPTGCLTGFCHACEVEMDEAVDICACISVVPEDRETLTLTIYADPTW